MCPDVKNYKWRLNPVWHRMLYSCTHMATVGFKGLSWSWQMCVVWLSYSVYKWRLNAVGIDVYFLVWLLQIQTSTRLRNWRVCLCKSVWRKSHSDIPAQTSVQAAASASVIICQRHAVCEFCFEWLMPSELYVYNVNVAQFLPKFYFVWPISWIHCRSFAQILRCILTSLIPYPVRLVALHCCEGFDVIK